MHFFTKTSLIFLTITLLFACESKSSKSNSDSNSKKETKEWSKADKRKCIREGIKEMNEATDEEREGWEIILEKSNLSKREFSECMCEKAEEDYDSYSEAEKDTDLMDEEEAMDYLFEAGCVSEEVKEMFEEMSSNDDYIGNEEYNSNNEYNSNESYNSRGMDLSICDCLEKALNNPELDEPPIGCEWMEEISDAQGEKLMEQAMIDCPDVMRKLGL